MRAKITLRLAIILVIVLLVIGASLLALKTQQGTSESGQGIRGNVVVMQCQGVDNAACKSFKYGVQVMSADGKKLVAQTTADKKGHFKLGLPVGTYQIYGKNISSGVRMFVQSAAIQKDKYLDLQFSASLPEDEEDIKNTGTPSPPGAPDATKLQYH